MFPWLAIPSEGQNLPFAPERQTTSFSVPTISISLRRLIVAGLGTRDAVSINLREIHVRIDKAQDVHCLGMAWVDRRVPRTPKKSWHFTGQYSLGRILDDTQLVSRDPGMEFESVSYPLKV